MSPTSISLLDRLKKAAPNSPDWDRLHGLYHPLIQAWLSQIAGPGHHCDDLSQEILIVVVREIPRFKRQRNGSFRTWLRQITVNRCQAFFKTRKRQPLVGLGGSSDVLADLQDPNSALSHQWDQEHDRHVFQHLLQLVKSDFEGATWEAFTRFALQGKSAAEVAAELKTTENAVLLAKSRVLKRLREEAGGIFD
jgi:RNA polymerase sigma-70 factor, ECF subfamily